MKGTLLKSLMLCSLGFMAVTHVQANTVRDKKALKKHAKQVKAKVAADTLSLHDIVENLQTLRNEGDELAQSLRTLRQERSIARQEEEALMKGIDMTTKLQQEVSNLIMQLSGYTSDTKSDSVKSTSQATRRQLAELYLSLSMQINDLYRTAHANGIVSSNFASKEIKPVLSELVRRASDIESLVAALESDCNAIVRGKAGHIDEKTEKRLKAHLATANGLERMLNQNVYQANMFANNHSQSDDCEIGRSLRAAFAQLVHRTVAQKAALQSAFIANGIEY
jgi:hypothetical protein